MNYSEMAKKLLNQLQSKEITLDEFLKECAYWAVKEGFDELKPKFYPVRPAKIIEMEHWTAAEKLKIDWNQVWMLFPEVKKYQEERVHVTNWNLDTMHWLEEILLYIPVGDYPTREKINRRLIEFKALYEDTSDVKEAKKVFQATTA